MPGSKTNYRTLGFRFMGPQPRSDENKLDKLHVLQFERNALHTEYYQQGRMSFEMPSLIQQRHKIKHSSRLKSVALEFWTTAGKQQTDTMDFDEYKRIHNLIVAVLAPELTEAEADESALEDWEEDLQGWPQMTCSCYIEGLCAIVDLWTDSIDEDSYVQFLSQLYRRITVAVSNASVVSHWSAMRRVRQRSFRCKKDVVPFSVVLQKKEAEELSRDDVEARSQVAALRTPRGKAEAISEPSMMTMNSESPSLDAVLEHVASPEPIIIPRRISRSLRFRGSRGWLDGDELLRPSTTTHKSALRRLSQAVILGEANRMRGRSTALARRLIPLAEYDGLTECASGTHKAGESGEGGTFSTKYQQGAFSPTRISSMGSGSFSSSDAAAALARISSTACISPTSPIAGISHITRSPTASHSRVTPNVSLKNSLSQTSLSASPELKSPLSLRTSVADVDIFSKLSLSKLSPDLPSKARPSGAMKPSHSAPDLPFANSQGIVFASKRRTKRVNPEHRRQLLLNVFQDGLDLPSSAPPKAKVRLGESRLSFATLPPVYMDFGLGGRLGCSTQRAHHVLQTLRKKAST